MTSRVAPELVRWVQEGANLFSQTLQSLHRLEETERKAEELARENDQLRKDLLALQAELNSLREERVEVAETLKTFAEHVTQIVTLALQRLGRRGA